MNASCAYECECVYAYEYEYACEGEHVYESGYRQIKIRKKPNEK